MRSASNPAIDTRIMASVMVRRQFPWKTCARKLTRAAMANRFGNTLRTKITKDGYSMARDGRRDGRRVTITSKDGHVVRDFEHPSLREAKREMADTVRFKNDSK